MAAVAAVAQETPPTTDPQNKEAEPEEKQAPDRWNEITIGYNSFRENSSLSYYARPTEGLSLHYLRLFNPGSDAFPYAKLTIRGLPKQDNVVNAYVALNRGHTVLRGSRTQHSYYVLDWRPKDPSEDNESRYTLDHSFTPDFGGFLTYVANERDGRYPAPRDPEHTTTRFVAAGVGGKVAGGNLGVTVSDRRTFDDTGARPETLQRQVNASYSRDFGNDFSLEGTAGYSRIEQAGLDSSGIHTYTLSGAWDLGPATGMQFLIGQQNLDLNTILNAYARKRLVSSARLVHRWPGWSLQFGYKHRETERVRADHSFVDVPKVNEYDARLAGKLGPARLTLRGSWEDLRATAVMDTEDSRSLLWDDRATFQAKLDGGTDLFSAYGTYTYRFQQNKERGVDIGWHNIAVGGSYVFTPVLNGYAEFSADDFRVGGNAESGQSLDFYFPSSRTVAMGLNWSKDPSLSASASLNYYESGDVKGTQLTFSVRRRLGPDHDLELVVAPWLRDDKLYDLTGYRATFLLARYTVKF
jgi:hypothetical protein